MSYKSTYNKYILSVAAAGVIWSLMACRSEGEPALGNGQETLTFEGYVHSEAALATRATSEISAQDYNNVPFYIAMDYLDSQNDSQTEYGTYVVTPGMRGQFSPKERSSAINWYNRTGDHTFHAWDFPQTVSGTPYEPSTEPQKIYFDNSFGGTNNNELEKFIGAVSGPYNYESQGQYVPLHFYHLVAKINFVRFRAFSYDPSKFGYYSDPGVKITLYGLPQEAVFYPAPENDTEGNPVMPYVKGETQPDNVDNTDTSWQIEFTTPIQPRSGNNPAYICPGYDFSKIKFKVEIIDPNWNYTPTGPFYGSFGDLEFTDRTDKNDKVPILRAGEVLNLYINLYPEGGTGGGMTITPWDLLEDENGTSYPRPGIYQDSELDGLTGDNVDWEEMFGLLGYSENGEDVFNIYNNLELTGNELLIPDDYVLDGLGHLVTVPDKYDNIAVSNVRDIYLSNGTNTLWIDEDGNVWIQQEDGAFVKTTSTIEDSPLSFSPESYTLASA